MVVEAQTDPKRFQDTLEDMVFARERENKFPGYIANVKNRQAVVKIQQHTRNAADQDQRINRNSDYRR